jgi:formylmethanofuran dehydrogenase subunit B
VAGLRATLALAERCRASLEFLHDDAAACNLRVLQARGWHTTTLSEVRNRADLVVLCGVDLNANFQNFVPRIAAPPHALQQARRDARALVHLGPASQAPAVSGGLPLEHLPTQPAALPETLRTLQGLLAGYPLTLRAGRRRQALQALAARVLAAEYPVFVWAPGQLDPRDGDLVIATVCEIVADLNRTRRAAGLALGGDDGGQSALAVSTWLTGFPLGASFAEDRLQGRVANASAARDEVRDAADLVLFVSSFSRREPPRTEAPVIALTPPGFAPPGVVEVHLPIGVPGIDHAGQILRTDGVVALPLRRLREGGLPSGAEVLRRLHDTID